MRLLRHLAFALAVAVAAAHAPPAAAISSYYTSNCSGCHGTTVATCNGCHAHGTHADSSKSSINVGGTLNKTSFAPGETVTVTVNGGYRTGWVRVVLFDQTGRELARSSCPGGMGGCSTSVYPVTLTAPAPTTAGSYAWMVAWYGNQFDASGASTGSASRGGLGGCGAILGGGIRQGELLLFARETFVRALPSSDGRSFRRVSSPSGTRACQNVPRPGTTSVSRSPGATPPSRKPSIAARARATSGASR